MFVFIHLHMNPLGSDGEMGVCVQEYGFTLPSLSSCIYIYMCLWASVCADIFRHILVFFCAVFSVYVSKMDLFTLRSSLLLEDLLGAGGGDVQQSPGCVGIQLLLVTTQGPNIHHPHHLLLVRGEKSKGSETVTWCQTSEQKQSIFLIGDEEVWCS